MPEETPYQRDMRRKRERKEARMDRKADLANVAKRSKRNAARNRVADHVDGYDRDDTGESPDF